jgi:hypothetical protein
MANSYLILQIHHAKSFKMGYIAYMYFSYLSRYSLIQIQVTIFLSGTDVMYSRVQKSKENFVFRPKMAIFRRAGMREGGLPLPLAFQYLIFMI